MLAQFLANNVLLVTVIWTAVYVLDYYLTIFSARVYREGANAHIVFEGSLELTPAFQKDVDALRLFSRQFLARLGISWLCVWAIWLVAVPFIARPELFSIVIGALVLREAAIHIRHAHNVFTFRCAKDPRAMSGKLEYSRWFTLQRSAVEFGCFAVLFMLTFVLTTEWFFVGGVLSCAETAREHWSLARKARRTAPSS